MKAGTNGGGGGCVRVIAVIPEPPQRVQGREEEEARSFDVDGSDWISPHHSADGLQSLPHLSGGGFTTVRYSSLMDLNYPMTIISAPLHPPTLP